MNKIVLSLLAFVLLGQLSWLGYSYHARVQEIAESPHILLEVKPYDPRDLFRGDYLSLDVEEEIPLNAESPCLGKSLYWESGYVYAYLSSAQIPYPAREKETEEALCLQRGYSGSAAFVGFVRPDAEGVYHLSRVERWGSREDACREGERRLPSPLSASICASRTQSRDEHSHPVCRVSLRRSLRYYVPEKKGNHPSLAWNAPADKKARVTMECVLRERNGLMPVQVFVDGVPYLEAYERWKQSKQQQISE